MKLKLSALACVLGVLSTHVASAVKIVTPEAMKNICHCERSEAIQHCCLAEPVH